MSIKNITKVNKRIIPHFINGYYIHPTISENFKTTPIINPSTLEHSSNIITNDFENCKKAIKNSQEGFNEWSKIPVHKRVDTLIDWYKWLTNHSKEICNYIHQENGKTLEDAKAELDRGLEVLQFSFSAPTILKGETSIINKNLEIYTKKQPLGITLGITPFNFPAMIPLWMAPLAIVTGNSIIIKASDKCPSATLFMANGAVSCGIPRGVFNVVQGGAEITNSLITNNSVKSVSFVGSTSVGKKVYDLSTEYGKRTQINMGAKNHAVCMSDCDEESTSSSIVSAFCGGTGMRCMAISVLILVNTNDSLVEKIIEKTRKIIPKKDIGPLISKDAKNKVIFSVNCAQRAGGVIIQGDLNKYYDTNFIEPIIIDNVNEDMDIYNEELFAPVLCIMRVNSLDEAIQIVNENEYGNGTAIFTESLYNAQKYENEVNVTQCGINVPIPVSPPYFSWTSTKESYRGSHYIYGDSAFDFYTQKKTIMKKTLHNDNIDLNIPTN